MQLVEETVFQLAQRLGCIRQGLFGLAGGVCVLLAYVVWVMAS